MAIERAVVKGTIGDITEIRNMFTGQVVESGGDTSASLWSVYITDFFGDAVELMPDSVHFYEYEVFTYNGGSWILKDTVSMSADGQSSTEGLLNAAAVVLIGKASGLRKVGRKFLGAISEGASSGNGLVSSALINAAAALVNYISPVNGIGGGTLTPGIVSSGGTFHAFVGGSVSSLLGTMRRRKPNVGM